MTAPSLSTSSDVYPEHWRQRRLKMLVKRFYSGGTPPTSNEDFWNGEIPWVSPKDMKSSAISTSEDKITQSALDATNLPLLEPGHLLMVVRSGILRHTIPTAINVSNVSINQDIKALKLCSEIDAWYLKYYIDGLQDQLLNLWRKPGTTVESLEYDYYSEHPIPLPPLETQRRIARFLDEKTARIDALIEKKRALLDRLAEKRQALITQAVTKGLNPDAPMKDSGLDWLGPIPAHWEVLSLSTIASIIDCKHRTPEYLDDGIPLVSTSEIRQWSIDYETKRRVSLEEFAEMSEGGRRPAVGDIIYSRNASVGAAALVRSPEPVCLGQDLCLIRPINAYPEYLEYYLNSRAALEQLESVLVGATFKRVNVQVIKKYKIILPPREEAVEICRYLEAHLMRQDRVRDKVIQSENYLTEYRTSLITAAVTGKITGLQ